MASESFTLETVDGELDVPKTDLLSLEVELDNELASCSDCVWRSATAGRCWTYSTRSDSVPGCPADHGGFDTGTEELMSGYITHVKPDFRAARAVQAGNLGYGPERRDGPGGALYAWPKREIAPLRRRSSASTVFFLW